MWSQIKRLLKSTLGKVAVFASAFPLWRLLYNTIDAWGNGLMIWDSLPSILRFLNSTAGTLLVMLIGFALIALQLHRQSGEQSDVPVQSREPATPAEPVSRMEEQVRENADYDKRAIAKAILAYEPRLIYRGLDDHAPYFDITFTVFNGSGFSITIDNEISGSVYLDSNLLSGSIKVMGSGLVNFPHGESTTLALRQWVNQEEAKIIKNPVRPDSALSCAGLTILLRGGTGFTEEVDPQKLKLPAVHLDHGHVWLTVESELNTLKTKYRRLHEAAEAEKDHIDDHVKLERVTLGDLILKASMYSVRFGLYITNNSVLDISIEKQISGLIRFEGIDLLAQKRVINDVVDAPHGTTKCLTIEQRLSKEEAQVIYDARHSFRANFYFDKLVVNIIGGENSPEVVLKRLSTETACLAAFPRELQLQAKRLQELSTVYGMGRQLYELLRIEDTPLPVERFKMWQSGAQRNLEKIFGEAEARRICLEMFRHPVVPTTASFQRHWLESCFVIAEDLMRQELERIKH